MPGAWSICTAAISGDVILDISTIIGLIGQKESMEFLRLGVVYVHLLACCVAIGLVFASDAAMIPLPNDEVTPPVT